MRGTGTNRRVRRGGWPVVGWVALVVAVGATPSPGWGAAPTPEVVVINGDANAVPVDVVGGSIDVGGGSVDVSGSVVDIGSTVDVSGSIVEAVLADPIQVTRDTTLTHVGVPASDVVRLTGGLTEPVVEDGPSYEATSVLRFHLRERTDRGNNAVTEFTVPEGRKFIVTDMRVSIPTIFSGAHPADDRDGRIYLLAQDYPLAAPGNGFIYQGYEGSAYGFAEVTWTSTSGVVVGSGVTLDVAVFLAGKIAPPTDPTRVQVFVSGYLVDAP